MSNMWIDGIEIRINHPTQTMRDSETSADAPQVIFPEDWSAWIEAMKQSIPDSLGIDFKVSSTSSPSTVAIVISPASDGGSDFSEGSAFLLAMDCKAFGFIVDINTLKKLKAAISAAIDSIE